jgi:hypothetical protein
MKKISITTLFYLLMGQFIIFTTACDENDEKENKTEENQDDQEELTGTKMQIKNDFDNPEMPRNPPWTICKASYLGVEIEEILTEGESTKYYNVNPGLDYVLMVLAWEDPDCNPENSLPVASRNEEEIVSGQTRTIYLNMPNHQGPCPPEGIAPIPEELYNRILELWPEYEFLPYEDRTQNSQCQN